jgi:hypothetical protein
MRRSQEKTKKNRSIQAEIMGVETKINWDKQDQK